MAIELQSVGMNVAMPAAASVAVSGAQATRAADRAAMEAVAAPSSPAPAVPAKADLQFDPVELRSRVQEAVDRLNEQMVAKGRDLSFSIDERLDRTIVTVRSSASGEIVRQIPDESLLQVARSIEDLKGILYNEII